MSDCWSGKIAEGKSVMWGTRLQPMAFSTNLGCFTKHSSALEWRTEKVMWIVFTSILCAGHGLTAGLFVYCTGVLMCCCEGKIELKVEKCKGISWPADWLSTYLWTQLSMGIRVGYLQSKESSPSPLSFKTQPAFAIKPCVFTLIQILTF